MQQVHPPPASPDNEAIRKTAKSTDRIEELMEKLSASTEKLYKSSERLERYTENLVFLTMLLIGLTIVLIIIPPDLSMYVKMFFIAAAVIMVAIRFPFKKNK